MYLITPKARQKIIDYVDEGIFDEEILGEVFRVNKKDKFAKIMKKYLGVNELTIAKVWNHIINNHWTDTKSIFKNNEIMLIKELLNSEGVIMYGKIKKEILSDFLAYKAVKGLMKHKIVDTIDFKSTEKLIIIHPKLKKDVFNQEED